MNVNDVSLIGTIGRDVNLHYLSSGKVVATTSIKVKRRAQEYSW
jgi:single-stranded DNA-binding protein